VERWAEVAPRAEPEPKSARPWLPPVSRGGR
jgi:hypothetical protein